LPYSNRKTENADIQNEIKCGSKALEWILDWSLGNDFDKNTEKGSSITKFHTIEVFFAARAIRRLVPLHHFAGG
jgi:hypothetical protein